MEPLKKESVHRKHCNLQWTDGAANETHSLWRWYYLVLTQPPFTFSCVASLSVRAIMRLALSRLGQGTNPPSLSSPQEQLLSKHNIVTIQNLTPFKSGIWRHSQTQQSRNHSKDSTIEIRVWSQLCSKSYRKYTKLLTTEHQLILPLTNNALSQSLQARKNGKPDVTQSFSDTNVIR